MSMFNNGTSRWRQRGAAYGLVFGCLTPVAFGQDAAHHSQEQSHEQESAARFPDEPIPLKLAGFPQRPKPILELGPRFLGTGTLDPGFELPGGAVWQPALLIYGTYRTAFQTFDDGADKFTEWVNRLDLFGNLQLTSTERILVGMRPLDQDGRFTGYALEPGGEADGWLDEFNGRLTTFFFEGDIGELLPNLDRSDFGTNDWGFSVGRQPLVFQEGLLINDTIDGVALVRDTLTPKGGSDLRLTFFYGWDNIHRDNNEETGGTNMFALFTESDFPSSTYQFDAVYIHDDEGRADGFYWGAGAIQRLRHFNTAFRVLGSYALDDESAAVSTGHLLFSEVSWTPHHTNNLVYVNGFWGIDEFASAARGPATGGPLGRTGVLFAAVGLGNYGAALGNRADNAVGGAIGYQMFFDETRKQLILEAGGRTGTKGDGASIFALGARYQQAIGQHTILRFDVFGAIPEEGDEAYGARVELQFKF